MNEFVYFNQRLTDKLNRIWKHPITIVCGGAGVGKTYAVQKYLLTAKADTLWHTMKEPDFSFYIKEFTDALSVWESALPEQPAEGKNTDPADLAVSFAGCLKKHYTPGRKVYVLEYMGAEMPDKILEFLLFLARQHIAGIYIIVTLRIPWKAEHPDTAVNFIEEDCFLLNPAEIIQAFGRQGVLLGYDEAAWLYLCSLGYIAAIKEFYYEMRRNGKTAVYQHAEQIAGNILPAMKGALPGERSKMPVAGRIPELAGVEECIRKYELTDAHIALEKAKLKAAGSAEGADACLYAQSLILALEGKAVKAVEELAQAFERRIREKRTDSALGILFAGMQLRIFLGERWYEEEKELILELARISLLYQKGMSGRFAALALLHAEDYYALLACVEEKEGWDAADDCIREYLAAAAYDGIGEDAAREKHLDKAFHLAFENGDILASLQFFSIFHGQMLTEAKDPSIHFFAGKDFQEMIRAYRKAEKRNNEGVFADARKKLTVRETEIAENVGKGMSNKEVAAALNISENTVKASLKTIFRKLGISSRKDLM